MCLNIFYITVNNNTCQCMINLQHNIIFFQLTIQLIICLLKNVLVVQKDWQVCHCSELKNTWNSNQIQQSLHTYWRMYWWSNWTGKDVTVVLSVIFPSFLNISSFKFTLQHLVLNLTFLDLTAIKFTIQLSICHDSLTHVLFV